MKDHFITHPQFILNVKHCNAMFKLCNFNLISFRVSSTMIRQPQKWDRYVKNWQYIFKYSETLVTVCSYITKSMCCGDMLALSAHPLSTDLEIPQNSWSLGCDLASASEYDSVFEHMYVYVYVYAYVYVPGQAGLPCFKHSPPFRLQKVPSKETPLARFQHYVTLRDISDI